MLLQADSYNSGYCALVDPDSGSSTATATSDAQAADVSIAVAAALRYDFVLNTMPNCSKITLTQSQFAGNKAIGGGGGAIFWDGPVSDLIVSCSDTEDATGESMSNFCAVLCCAVLCCPGSLLWDGMSA